MPQLEKYGTMVLATVDILSKQNCYLQTRNWNLTRSQFSNCLSSLHSPILTFWMVSFCWGIATLGLRKSLFAKHLNACMQVHSFTFLVHVTTVLLTRSKVMELYSHDELIHHIEFQVNLATAKCGGYYSTTLVMCAGEKEPSHKVMLHKERCRGYLMVRYTTHRGAR